MEFVDGVNLRQAMKAGRFTPEQALAIVPPVCEALQYAHEQGIVHRDIKPENLLLDKNGRVKIADFGIAKMLRDGDTLVSVSPRGAETSEPAADSASDLARTGVSASLTAAGTPHYMAPEQRSAPQRTDHRADIYSLGVVLYELLTGELPSTQLQPPSRKVQIDVRLDEIVLRALEQKPELRYATAAEFRTQVETVATTGSSQSEAAPVSPAPIFKTAQSYVTTPEYLASSRSKFYVYTGSGTLSLDRGQLTFSEASSNKVTVVPLAAIRELSLGNYPWLAKPIPLHYLNVTWSDAQGPHQLLLTPYENVLHPVWKTNRLVAEWQQALSAAVEAATGRAPTCRPAPPHRPNARELVLTALILAVLVSFVVLMGVVLLNLLKNQSPERQRLICLSPVFAVWLVLGVRACFGIVRSRRNPDATCKTTFKPFGLCTLVVAGLVCALFFSDRMLRSKRSDLLHPQATEVAAGFPRSPLIERVEVSSDRAVVRQRAYSGEGMIIQFGSGTNRWTPKGVYLEAMFDVTMQPSGSKGIVDWLIKTRRGTGWSYRVDCPDGELLGKITFYLGTPAAEADGSHVIAKFFPEAGEPLPIAVRLEKDTSAPPQQPTDASGAPASGPIIKHTHNDPNNSSLGILTWLLLALATLGGLAWLLSWRNVVGIALICIGLFVAGVKIHEVQRAHSRSVDNLELEMIVLLQQWRDAVPTALNARRALSRFESKGTTFVSDTERQRHAFERERLNGAMSQAEANCDVLSDRIGSVNDRLSAYLHPAIADFLWALAWSLPLLLAGWVTLFWRRARPDASTPPSERPIALLLLGLVVLALLCGAFLLQVGHTGFVSTSQEIAANFPTGAHIGGNQHSVMVVHDHAATALHYVFLLPRQILHLIVDGPKSRHPLVGGRRQHHAEKRPHVRLSARVRESRLTPRERHRLRSPTRPRLRFARRRNRRATSCRRARRHSTTARGARETPQRNDGHDSHVWPDHRAHAQFSE